MNAPKHPPSSGNALFLILIAVALFAALSYAVTSSGRGGGSVSKEQAAIHAAQITQYAAAMQAAVQRMILTGTAVEDIRFCSDHTSLCTIGGAVGDDGVCQSGADCVFAAEGGGITPVEVPQNARGFAGGAIGYLFGALNVVSENFDGVGTAAAELSMAAVVTEEVCLAINRGLGLDVSSIPDDADAGDGLIPGYPGAPYKCITTDLGDTYHAYLHALVER